MKLRKLLRLPWARYAAILAVAAILATVLWIVFRDPVRQLWSYLNFESILYPQREVELSPLLICTGVDSNGVPLGVSDTFSASQVQDTGVMVFITYGGADPKKNTFQIRWTIEGKVYKSTVGKFESETDFICLNLGKDLPAGSHSFEFLVDGEVRRSASMVIEDSSASNSPRDASRRKSRRSSRDQEIIKIPDLEGEAQTAPVPPSTTQSPVPVPTILPERQERTEGRKHADVEESLGKWKMEASSTVRVHAAKHKHRLGNCSGELTLTPDSIEFSSHEHYFKHAIDSVQVDGNGIRDRNGKIWRFDISGEATAEQLRLWKTGQLFK